MRALREFLAGESVRSILDACRESPAVQGVLVQIDPRWLLAWRLGESYDPESPRRGFAEVVRHHRFWDRDPATLPHSPWSTPWRPYRLFDVADLREWRPELFPNREWDEYRQWPIDLRICLYPRERFGEVRLPQFESPGFRILYETRPVARLFAGPQDSHRPIVGGVSIGVNAAHAGTLGGILTDRLRQKYYGVTCAHVVGGQATIDQPSRFEGRSGGGTIGTVVALESPRTFPPGTPKLVVNQRGNASKYDVALIELSRSTAAQLRILKMGAVVDWADLDDIAQDEALEFTGRSSDWQKVVKSSVVPFYNLTNQLTGDEYCYENPLVFREPSGGAAALPGDSGAWVCKEVGTDYHWAAMIVGGDKQLGFAIAATTLKQWWETSHRFHLDLC